jgi:hypothetical protein
MRSHLSMAIISLASGVLFRKPFPIFWSFPLVVSKFQVLFQGLSWALHQFLYKVRDSDTVSVLYMWLSSFPNTICWRGCLFYNVCFWWLCWESGGCNCMISGSSSLFCCSFCLFLWLCSAIWNLELWYLQYWCLCSGLHWLFEDFCISIQILELFLQFYYKKILTYRNLF